MSKASGSIDLKSLKVAGEGASKYITVIDGNGIKVHAANNTATNYAKINASGMEIFRSGTSVAKFGVDDSNDAISRIGAESGKNVIVNSSGMDVRNVTTSLASFGQSGARIGVNGEGYLNVTSSGIQFYSGSNNTSQAYIGRWNYGVTGGNEYFFARFGESASEGNVSVRTNPIDSSGNPIPRIQITDGTNVIASLYKDEAYDSDPNYEEGYSGTLKLGSSPTQNRGFFLNGISRPDVNDTSTRQGIGIINVQGNSDSYLDINLRGYNKIRITPDEVMITSGGKTTYYNNDGVVHSSAGAARIKAENYSAGTEVGIVADASSQIGLYDYINGYWLIKGTSASVLHLGKAPIIGDHSSPIGTIELKNNTNQSISSGTSWVTSGCTLTLTTGIWSIDGSVSFASNTSGRRGVAIYDGSDQILASMHTQSPVSGGVTRMHTSCPIALESTTTISIRCFQSSGSSLSCDAYLRAVRIR